MPARIWFWLGLAIWFLLSPVVVPVDFFHDYLFPPLPGVAIAVLGGLAVVMTVTISKEPTKKEKTGWIIVAFVLICFEMWAIRHDRTKQDQQFGDVLEQGRNILSKQNDMHIFLTNNPNLALSNRRAVVKAYSPPEIPPAIPPISNKDLRKEVAAYTEHLRGIEGQRDYDRRELFPFTKGGEIAPLYDNAEHEQQWEKIEKKVEDDFIKNDLGNGIRLRDELLKRLKQAGPPTPMNALLGVFPTPERGVPESELPFTQLADYLNELAQRLP